MNIRDLLTRLDEINRRDFLKKIGATGAAAVGGAIPNAISAVASNVLAPQLMSWMHPPVIWQSLLGAGFEADAIKNYLKYLLDSGITRDALTSDEINSLVKALGNNWEEIVVDRADELDTDYFSVISKIINKPTVADKMGQHLAQVGLDVEDENIKWEKEKTKKQADQQRQKQADIEADRERLIPDWGNVVENYQKIEKRIL